jgi:radical SAM superfamily enzyme YgiQ (UPF0313 family)
MEKGYLEKLSDLIIKEDLDVLWGGYAVINEGLTSKILKNMHKAGCRFLAYGIESASSRLLKIMRKGVNLKLASKILRETKEAGISTVTFWLTDFPGERQEDIEETKRFLKKNKEYIDVAFFSKFLLFKYSDIYLNPQKYPPIDKHIGSHDKLHTFWKEIKDETENFQPFKPYKTIGMIVF